MIQDPYLLPEQVPYSAPFTNYPGRANVGPGFEFLPSPDRITGAASGPIKDWRDVRGLQAGFLEDVAAELLAKAAALRGPIVRANRGRYSVAYPASLDGNVAGIIAHVDKQAAAQGIRRTGLIGYDYMSQGGEELFLALFDGKPT